MPVKPVASLLIYALNLAMKRLILLVFTALLACSTDSAEPNLSPDLYFPPAGTQWETISVESLGWNQGALDELRDFLELKNTRSFMILVDGKIAVEYYFGSHTANSPWYWASAGKTLTTAMTGIAERDGLLLVDDKVSTHLGAGWTSLTSAQEDAIKISHLLTMTSGLDDVANGDCVSPDCLTYVAPAGTRWAYDNVYVKLQDVVAQASGETWKDYFNSRLKQPIGMTGTWINSNDLSIYWSDTRSMARFGLLMLAKGKWGDTRILPEAFCAQATQTSQPINKAYGYLWWLNGKESYRLPQLQLEFDGTLIPSAPQDMYAAMGMNDQRIYVIPSRNMVVVRMGDSAEGTNFALSGFDNALWEKINAAVN